MQIPKFVPKVLLAQSILIRRLNVSHPRQRRQDGQQCQQLKQKKEIAPQPLELSFGRAEVGSLFIGVFIGTIVCGDGQSNWFKGVQLVTVYIIIATMFYFIPELNQ